MSTRPSSVSGPLSQLIDGLALSVWRIRMPLIFVGGVFAGGVLMLMALLAIIQSDPSASALAQDLPRSDLSHFFTLAMVLVAGIAFWCGNLLKGRTQ